MQKIAPSQSRMRVVSKFDNPEEDDKEFFKPNYIIKNRWRVIIRLGNGGFGQIYAVKDLVAGINAALKAEPTYPIQKSQLPIELQVLKVFQGFDHSAQLMGAGVDSNCNFIVMQLLGPSLSSLRRKCPHDVKRFSTNTCLRVFEQCLESLRDLHSVRVLHRDIKPSNFAMGYPNTPKKHTLYIIDFGLSRFYALDDGTLRPQRPKAGFRGTMRYCAANAHKRIDLSRADDLRSLFYMLFEMWKGGLPWKDEVTHSQVLKLKERYTQAALAKKLPVPEMADYVAEMEHLTFTDQPDYEHLIKLLHDAMDREHINATDLFDWENNFKCLISDE